MASHEQLSFNYEKNDLPPASFKDAAKSAEGKPMSIEVDDECQYCGAPYESERSCQYCASHPMKKAFKKNAH